ncbi:lactosylceramide 4-alpha-galactosyltransferase-like [Chironomus tepperi]|uniref:lactosylceramide 4-alpha-galactosyltransferase-like n=1 Tax=Chironomus tepperi TaxID=113505 RepID=UPI00391F4768
MRKISYNQYQFKVLLYDVPKKIFILLFLFIFTLILLYINLEKSEQIAKKHERLKVSESTLFIDNILDMKKDDIPKNSIFFLDTTRMKSPNKVRDLTLRQACSIESAAVTNENVKVFIVLVSPYKTLDQVKYTPAMEAILSYKNVHVNSMNLLQFSADALYDNFVANGNLLKSRFVKQHTSDFVRMLILIKYGGTYIDTDMIVRKKLKDLPSNFICRDHGFLNAAIIRLQNNLGKKVGKLFIDDLIRNFNGSEWGWNGPLMLTRVLTDLCQTSNVNEMINCNGFHVLNEDICYPINGLEWNQLFNEQHASKVLQSVEHSYFVHFWNKLSQHEKIACNSSAAYAQLARKFCPKTFSLCHEYF